MATVTVTAMATRPPPPDHSPRRLAVRAFVGLLVAAALLWLVIPVTVAGVMRYRQPAAALGVAGAFGAPADARAAAADAKLQLGDPLQPGRLRELRAPGRLDGIRARAAAALLRDPTTVEAATALGLTYALAGDMARAERAFLYLDRLSRRDIPAQLWLIERAVQRNDIPGALRHYDTVLRVSPQMHAQLFPILIQAIRVPEIAVALNRLLRTQRPVWGGEFMKALLRGSGDGRSLYLVTRGLLDPADPLGREQLTSLLRALSNARAYDLAWRAYVEAWPARGRGAALLWNGDFSSDPGAAPFDWGFADDAALAPERRVRTGDDFALFLPAGVSADADAARQLVRLAPGSYRLTGLAGGVPDDRETRPLVAIACAAENGATLAQQDLPVAGDAGAGFAIPFTVPAGCAHQWVSIRVRGNLDRQLRGAPWVDRLVLVRN